MSTYDKLGGKTAEELPRVPTNVETTAAVGAVDMDWVNNNTLTGTTNMTQLFQSEAWVDKNEYPASATTGTVDGLITDQDYNVRVSVLKSGLYYPSATYSSGILPPPTRPDNCIYLDESRLVESVESNVFNMYPDFTIGMWVNYTSETIPVSRLYDTSSTNNVAPYLCRISGPTSQNFQVMDNTGPPGFADVYTSTSGSLTEGSWYYLVLTFDDAAGNGEMTWWDDAGNMVAQNNDAAGAFNRSNDTTAKLAFSGHVNFGRTLKLNAAGFWARVMDSNEIAEIYNNGGGLSYADLSTAQKVDMADWFDGDNWNGTSLTGNHTGNSMIRYDGLGTISTVAI